MTMKLDFRWHLREIMANRGMFSTTDLRPLLAERGVNLSVSQVYRLVTEKPERLNMKVLLALLDILGCGMEQLIEPIPLTAAAKPRRTAAAAGGGENDEPPAGMGSFRPKPARITE
ncbi:helix-turn-helix transcriptional regulator [Acrocarpospora sp. B8E8]|uniref:helix-turn-helix domain-containing protein n=1 Tax=Acrocarpospora sp. B8E8 TaxID=3153572 RepID=UPI00325F50C4